MAVTTGTPETRTEHSRVLGGLGVALALGTPAVLTIVSLAIDGFGAISWVGALVWGVAATLVMTGLLEIGRSTGLTRLEMWDLLGSLFADPQTSTARVLGAIIHAVNGMLLAVAWAYTMVLLGWEATWWTGTVWGAFIGVLALLMLTSMGVLHPAIRDHHQADPGMLGMNLGTMTPVGLVVGHLVYGFVLGIFYQVLPLA